MSVKFFSILFIFIAVLGMDRQAWRKAVIQDRVVYVVLMVASLYLSIQYILRIAWPNLDQLMEYVFSEPAKHFIKLLTSTSE